MSKFIRSASHPTSAPKRALVNPRRCWTAATMVRADQLVPGDQILRNVQAWEGLAETVRIETVESARLVGNDDMDVVTERGEFSTSIGNVFHVVNNLG